MFYCCCVKQLGWKSTPPRQGWGLASHLYKSEMLPSGKRRDFGGWVFWDLWEMTDRRCYSHCASLWWRSKNSFCGYLSTRGPILTNGCKLIGFEERCQNPGSSPRLLVLLSMIVWRYLGNLLSRSAAPLNWEEPAEVTLMNGDNVNT